MSYESTIEHLRSQVAQGAAHRRHRERRRRTSVGLTGVALLLLVIAAVVAIDRGDPRTIDTVAPPDPHTAVCDALIDVLGGDEAKALPIVRTAAARLGPMDPLRLSVEQFVEVDQPRTMTAYDAAEERCAQLGHPDFNPVFVPAVVPDAGDLASRFPGATMQLLRPATAAEAETLRDTVAGTIHRISPVEVARVDPRATIAWWRGFTADGRQFECWGYQWDRAVDDLGGTPAGGGGCPNHRDHRFFPADTFWIDTGWSTSEGWRSTVFLMPTDAVAIVAEGGTQRIVQRPKARLAVVAWREPVPRITARAYDASGREVGCIVGTTTASSERC